MCAVVSVCMTNISVWAWVHDILWVVERWEMFLYSVSGVNV